MVHNSLFWITSIINALQLPFPFNKGGGDIIKSVGRQYRMNGFFDVRKENLAGRKEGRKLASIFAMSLDQCRSGFQTAFHQLRLSNQNDIGRQTENMTIDNIQMHRKYELDILFGYCDTG